MKPMATKKAALGVAQPARKRAALGDVSNVNKGETIVESKQKAVAKGLVSKAAHPTGITKNVARAPSTRNALVSKDANRSEERRVGKECPV